MAVRYPLYYSGGNLIAMTAGELTEWKEKAIYVYAQNPSAILTVVSGSGANISAMSDTRTQAGATSQSSSAFVAEGSTAEPSTVTVSYDKINLAYTTSGVGNTTDTGTSFPVYYDSDTGSIRAMSLTDIKDTFVHPCVDLLVSGTESATTAGTYTIASTTTLSNNTRVSTTPVFTDTRANTGAYTSEILRSAFETINKGLIEAGQSLGLPNKKIFYKIKLPLAIRPVYYKHLTMQTILLV